MKRNLYLFSGLGADERVFQKLDFSEYTITFIKWIIPERNESIENHASRLLIQIKSEKPILIGLSFGGIMAMEVAKLIDTEKIILLSSAKSKKEIPFYFRLIGFMRLYKILPAKILKSTNFITYWFFGTSSVAEQKLLKQILLDTNELFLKWAIEKIVRWKNKFKHNNIVHIHGSSDRILPIQFITHSHKINQGGHFMVLNKYEELNTILKVIIQ